MAANLSVVLELDNQGYIRSIRASEDAIKSFGRTSQQASQQANDSMDKTSQSAGRLSLAMQKLSGVIGQVGFAAFARNAILFGDAIQDLSDATDIAVPKILEIQKALELAGGKSENASKLITEFYKAIEEAAQGSDKTQAAFAKLGISLTDLKFDTTTQLLDKTSKGFANITDPAQRTSLALEIFGKSMMGVSPAKFAEELDNLNGKFSNQAESIKRAADLTEQFENALTKLKLAFLDVFTPIIKSLSNLIELLGKVPGLVEAISIAMLAIPGMWLGRVLTYTIGSAIRGFSALKNILTGTKTAADAAGKSVGAAAKSGQTVFKDRMQAGEVGSVIGGAVAVGGAAAAYMAGRTPEGDTATSQEADTAKRQQREVEIGKELQRQLESIRAISQAYKDVVARNSQRLALETVISEMSKEDADLYKNIADINTRANETIAKLEEKRQTAKGSAIALINTEIANVQALAKEEEAAALAASIRAARRKGEMETFKQLQEMSQEFNDSQAQSLRDADAAKMSAWEQLDALKRGFELTSERENLERSLRNLRSEDADLARKILDLEVRRREELLRIRQIQNLPFEDRQRREEEINATIDAEKERIERSNKLRKEEQDSFVLGWKDAYEKWRNNIRTESEYARDLFQTATRGFEDAILRFVQTGKLSFKGLMTSLLAEVARMQANKLFLSILGLGSGSGFFNKLLGSFGFGTGFGYGNLDYGGFFANGGTLGAGKWGIAGEAGPELITGPANITPMDRLAPSTNVTYNINAVDAASFRTLVARDPQFIYSVTEAGRRSQPTRRLA